VDPESPLRWTSKSVRVLSVALEALGHEISHTVVAELLHELGYSLQGNAKTQEGTQHPDRDGQFRLHRPGGEPVSAAAATRDLGRYEEEGTGRELQNAGRTWRPAGTPDRSGCTIFVIRRRGRRSRTASTISTATKGG